MAISHFPTSPPCRKSEMTAISQCSQGFHSLHRLIFFLMQCCSNCQMTKTSLSWPKLRWLRRSLRVSTKTPVTKQTSQTEFGQQMRSGDLPAYLSLNCVSNGIFVLSRWSFVQFRPNFQKFNLCVTYRRTDGRTDWRTDRRTDGRTHPLIEMREYI